MIVDVVYLLGGMVAVFCAGWRLDGVEMNSDPFWDNVWRGAVVLTIAVVWPLAAIVAAFIGVFWLVGSLLKEGH